MRVSAALVAALTFGSQSANAQVTKVGQGYLFRARFTKGETIRYSVTSVFPMQGQPKPMGFSMPIVQKVNGVSGGLADLSITVGPLQMNGQAMSKAQSSRVKVNSQLKLVSGTTSGGEASFTTLPANPIRVGGTWTATQALGAFGGGPGGKVQMTYKLLGVKNVAGRSVAALAVTFSKPGERPVTGSGAGHLDAATGLLRDMVLHMVLPAMGGEAGSTPLKVSIKVARA